MTMEQVVNNPNIIAEWDTYSESETKLFDLQIKDSTVIGAVIDFGIKHKSMSYTGNNYERSATYTNRGESSDNVVNETPDRGHLSNPGNHSVSNQHIVITYSNVEDEELQVLQEFVDMFELDAHVSWNDSVTHLIVKTQPTGRCIRTNKFMNALLLNCFIVSMEWAQNCLSSRTLLPEGDYIPLELSGEPSPLVSWRVGRGIIDSPMEWTSNCILYLHSSIEFNESYPEIILWARRAGFVLTNDLEEFKNEYRMRVILAEKNYSYTDVRSQLPNTAEMTSWLYDYKGVTIYLDWFLECLFRYKFVVINHYYQIMKLNPSMVEFADMDESLFEYENC